MCKVKGLRHINKLSESSVAGLSKSGSIFFNYSVLLLINLKVFVSSDVSIGSTAD